MDSRKPKPESVARSARRRAAKEDRLARAQATERARTRAELPARASSTPSIGEEYWTLVVNGEVERLRLAALETGDENAIIAIHRAEQRDLAAQRWVVERLKGPKLPESFRHTHTIEHGDKDVPVMLVERRPGRYSAFTEAEWTQKKKPVWEYDLEDGLLRNGLHQIGDADIRRARDSRRPWSAGEKPGWKLRGNARYLGLVTPEAREVAADYWLWMQLNAQHWLTGNVSFPEFKRLQRTLFSALDYESKAVQAALVNIDGRRYPTERYHWFRGLSTDTWPDQRTAGERAQEYASISPELRQAFSQLHEEGSAAIERIRRRVRARGWRSPEERESIV